MTPNRVFVIGAIVAVAGGLALAFAFLGTPNQQRLVSLDEERVSELQSIAVSVNDRYQGRRLPAILPETVLASEAGTMRDYQYRRLDATHYTLCATFATSNLNYDANQWKEMVVWPPRDWRHGGGHWCYKFDETQSNPVPLH